MSMGRLDGDEGGDHVDGARDGDVKVDVGSPDGSGLVTTAGLGSGVGQNHSTESRKSTTTAAAAATATVNSERGAVTASPAATATTQTAAMTMSGREQHREVRVRQLTEEQYKQLVDAFDLFDTDKSGVISAKELRSAMRSLGLNPTREDIRRIITHGDVDGDGNIDLDEFLAMMALQLDEKSARAKMLKVFGALDREARGWISVDDLVRISEDVGDVLTLEDATEMLDEADIDADGRVGAEDFLKLTKTLGLW
mmetsp:Transcript_13790/g.29842  ORF Transcript_13790/g.29842 Transcript_13790/m.29842 type:complete len:254 (+) Transcript_13790:196-957(+)